MSHSPHLAPSPESGGREPLTRLSRVLNADSHGRCRLVTAAAVFLALSVSWRCTGEEISFATPQPVVTGLLSPLGLAAGDVDGDGDTDLVTTDQVAREVAWHERTGSSWTEHEIYTSPDAGPRTTAVVDIDGDGDLDVVSGDKVFIGLDRILWHENLLGDGTTWTEHTVASGIDDVRSVSVADIDGDGDLDVISASAIDQTVAWHENIAGDGSGWTARTITAVANGAFSAVPGDIDGDGALDVVSASDVDGKVRWHRNSNGDGTAWLSFTVFTALSSGVKAVRIADLDRDGDLDLVSAAREDDRIRWHENATGNGSAWTTRDVFAAADSAQSVEIVDLDADGDLDLLSASFLDDSVRWYENTIGDATAWTARTLLGAVDGAVAVLAADFDSDGDLDVAGAAQVAGTLVWSEALTIHRSSGFPLETTLANPSRQPASAAAADLDGDGDLDVAVGFYFPSPAIVWYENASGDASNWASASIPGSFSFPQLDSGDVDGDGNQDLVVANASLETLVSTLR